MYPTISDLLNDIFGLNIPLPVQTFGFFVAIAFLLGAYTLSLELKRKEMQGLLVPVSRKVLRGAPATKGELLSNAVIGFIVGYKLLYFVLHYSELVSNPQEALLSAKGNLAGGIIAGALLAYLKYREKEKEKKEKPEWVTETLHPYELVGNITMVAAVSGLLGAKLFHNLEYPAEFFADPIGALLSFSGLTMYGGLIAGAAGTIWYCRRNGIGAAYISDAAAAGLMLAYGVGRIGCQLAGDGDWGIINTSPQPASLSFLPEWFWSYRYPHNVIGEGIPIMGCEGRHCFVLEDPVYPTPLYESILCIALFFVLWGVRKRFSAPGAFFSMYLLLNGMERFFIESIRVNAKYHLAGIEFTQAQLISVLLMLCGAAGLFYFRKKNPSTA